jgi:hypothetical protein
LRARLAGRVNTALNLTVFVGAFGMQWGFGAAVDMPARRRPRAARRLPDQPSAGCCALQVLQLALVPRKRR